MKTIAFGPLRDKIVGSWRWFGQDLAEELKKYYNIIYANRTRIPKCDLIFAVKLPDFTRKAIQTGIPVLYVSIDLFHSLEDFDKFKNELKYCTVVNQCHLLCDIIKDSHFIPHHIKYQTNANYREKGYILWVGGSQYKKIAQDYVKQHNLGLKVEYLSGIDWTSERQIIYQSEAKAAFDIKGPDFWQRTKPATKLVDFVASGIPIAANEYCSGIDFFKKYYKFNLVSPLDKTEWFSEKYFNEIQKIKDKIRCDLSLESIGLQYKKIIDRVLNIAE